MWCNHAWVFWPGIWGCLLVGVVYKLKNFRILPPCQKQNKERRAVGLSITLSRNLTSNQVSTQLLILCSYSTRAYFCIYFLLKIYQRDWNVRIGKLWYVIFVCLSHTSWCQHDNDEAEVTMKKSWSNGISVNDTRSCCVSFLVLTVS